jgi:predicted dienelactone hydrolase
VAVGLAAIGAAFAGCSSTRPDDRRSRAPTSTSTGPRAAPPATAAAVRSPSAVGSITLTVTRPGRRFDVLVLYPAADAGPAAAPLTAGRPFALIVFSPGFDLDPGVYDPLVARWASLGFVVAIPDYPFTAAGVPGGVNEADIVQHPADLEAAIDRLLEASLSPGTVLTGMIDRSRIGVAGHSDGGDVTEAAVSDSCCRDPRIRAAAVLSGAELTSFGGTYAPASVPLLVVQGDSDTINDPACSEQIYNTGGSPRFYLDLRGAGHLPPYTGDPSGVEYQQAVDRITALFWAAYLKGQSSALTTLESDAGAGPFATLITGGPVDQNGTCPGAP